MKFQNLLLIGLIISVYKNFLLTYCTTKTFDKTENKNHHEKRMKILPREKNYYPR